MPTQNGSRGTNLDAKRQAAMSGNSALKGASSEKAIKLSEDYMDIISPNKNKLLFRIFAILDLIVCASLFLLWIAGFKSPISDSNVLAYVIITVIWLLCPLSLFFLIKDYRNSR